MLSNARPHPITLRLLRPIAVEFLERFNTRAAALLISLSHPPDSTTRNGLSAPQHGYRGANNRRHTLFISPTELLSCFTPVCLLTLRRSSTWFSAFSFSLSYKRSLPRWLLFFAGPPLDQWGLKGVCSNDRKHAWCYRQEWSRETPKSQSSSGNNEGRMVRRLRCFK